MTEKIPKDQTVIKIALIILEILSFEDFFDKNMTLNIEPLSNQD